MFNVIAEQPSGNVRIQAVAVAVQRSAFVVKSSVPQKLSTCVVDVLARGGPRGDLVAGKALAEPEVSTGRGTPTRADSERHIPGRRGDVLAAEQRPAHCTANGAGAGNPSMRSHCSFKKGNLPPEP